MVSGYTLTVFPNAFILQQPQLKQQPTGQARSMFKRGIRTVQTETGNSETGNNIWGGGGLKTETGNFGGGSKN